MFLTLHLISAFKLCAEKGKRTTGLIEYPGKHPGEVRAAIRGQRRYAQHARYGITSRLYSENKENGANVTWREMA
jgi:hypothetical protein